VAHHAAPPSASLRHRLAGAWAAFIHIYRKQIWQSASLKSRSLKGICFSVLRVTSITLTVCGETRVLTRAAALGFSSLLGVGPLIAIAVLVAGFALGKNDPEMVAGTISRMIKVVAPQLEQYESIPSNQATVNPTLVDTINNIISASQSGSMGVLGVFTLLLIVLLMFKEVEDTFNDIWGVRQGRTLLMRVVLYWTVLTLGAVLFFAAVALLGAGTFVSVFEETLPLGPGLTRVLGWSLPAFSFALLAIVLMLFYRAIPNTRVFWWPAFAGGVVVTGLLVLNNFAAFFYVRRVILERDLYGGLALPLVLLSVLYVFWLCVLIGGIVSYAIQNVNFRNSQAAWGTLTEMMRERLSLVVFLTICRRFRQCQSAPSASDLSSLLKVPTQLLNECLNRLVRIKLVTSVLPAADAADSDSLYQPARPLGRITLFDFKTLDDHVGANPIGSSFEKVDPLISHYDAALARLGEQEFFRKNLDQLFEEHPYEETRHGVTPPDLHAR